MSATLEPGNQRRLSVSGSNRVLRQQFLQHQKPPLPDKDQPAEHGQAGEPAPLSDALRASHGQEEQVAQDPYSNEKKEV
jgi:hypothetical protein